MLDENLFASNSIYNMASLIGNPSYGFGGSPNVTINLDLDSINQISSVYAPKANPTFTGVVTLPAVNTEGNTNDRTAATTEFVTSRVDTRAPKASPTFTGVVHLPDVTVDNEDNNTAATTKFVTTKMNTRAPKANPAFTGVVVLPTVTAENQDNNTAATTNWVQNRISVLAPKSNPTFDGTVSVPTATASSNDTTAASTAFVKNAMLTLPSSTNFFGSTIGSSQSQYGVYIGKDTAGLSQVSLNGVLSHIDFAWPSSVNPLAFTDYNARIWTPLSNMIEIKCPVVQLAATDRIILNGEVDVEETLSVPQQPHIEIIMDNSKFIPGGDVWHSITWDAVNTPVSRGQLPPMWVDTHADRITFHHTGVYMICVQVMFNKVASNYTMPVSTLNWHGQAIVALGDANASTIHYRNILWVTPAPGEYYLNANDTITLNVTAAINSGEEWYVFVSFPQVPQDKLIRISEAIGGTYVTATLLH